MATAPFPDFTASELAEARRMNNGLMFLPRFRAPGRLRKFLIQSSLRAAELAPHGVPGVRATSRRIDWQGRSVALRILRTRAPARGVYIDYHGGGWSIGSAAMDDRVNARIAKDCGLVVVSVDYTLLPDIALPGMIAQCAAAADWVFEHAETEFGASDIVMGGESAGAHLAACSILRLRDSRKDFPRLKGVVLFYGCFDLSGTPSACNASRWALVLHGPSIQAGLARLAPGEAAGRQHPDISPVYADLRGLPPVLMLVGTRDPLIDDSRLMAKQWRAQSGNADLIVVPEAPHAFNRLPTRMAARTNAFVRTWVDEQLVKRTTAMAAAE
jgi:acetyl esterase/lipase